MKKTIWILGIVCFAFVSAAAYCAEPEDAVKGMLDAVKAGNWEEAVTFIDFDGMANAVKKMMEGMDEETKKMMEEQMGDMMDPVKIKENMISMMEADESKKDITYKIVETKDKKDDSATIVTEITETGKDPETVNFPVKKIKGKWLISFADMMPSGMEMESTEEEGEEIEETPEKGEEPEEKETEEKGE